MPVRIWWIATACTAFIFAVSMLTWIGGLTTPGSMDPWVNTGVLAIPTLLTGGIAIVATLRSRGAAKRG